MRRKLHLRFRERFCDRCDGRAAIARICRGLRGWRADMLDNFADLELVDFPCPAGLPIVEDIAVSAGSQGTASRVSGRNGGCASCRERARRKQEIRDA